MTKLFFFHILYFLQNNTSNGSSNTRSIAHDLISNTIFLRFDSDLANRVPSPLFIFECIHSFCFVFCLFVLLFSFSYSRAMSTLLVTMTARTRVFDREHLCKTRSFFLLFFMNQVWVGGH